MSIRVIKNNVLNRFPDKIGQRKDNFNQSSQGKIRQYIIEQLIIGNP